MKNILFFVLILMSNLINWQKNKNLYNFICFVLFEYFRVFLIKIVNRKETFSFFVLFNKDIFLVYHDFCLLDQKKS